MSEHEVMMVCALRYTFNLKTYTTINIIKYINNHIDSMSEECAVIMSKDIKNCFYYNKDNIFYEERLHQLWIRLEQRVMEIRNDSTRID